MTSHDPAHLATTTRDWPAVTQPGPGIEVVVVAFRGTELLRACLHSLDRFPTTRGPMLVHVVDNASGDGTPDMVARVFPHMRLYEQSANSGFSAANNVALRETTAPYVL